VLAAATIVPRNQLPSARVLARSFYEHHSGRKMSVLVVDAAPGDVEGGTEFFDVVHLEDLSPPMVELHRMAAAYDLSEFAAALKPHLLRLLLDRGAAAAIYLGPETRLFAPLDDVAEKASDEAIVLTPHATKPIPRDGRRVDETTILGRGTYDLGFLAVGQRGGEFLEFWSERLRRDCYIEEETQHFRDQRWVDFVPGMFGCDILRDPGYNLAVWNLDQRNLTKEGEQYLVDGRPLVFFHFSGFDPLRPYLLSSHQQGNPRVLLSERPLVAELCSTYQKELLDAGFHSAQDVGYEFGTLPNGIVLDSKLRRYYRIWLGELERSGDSLPPDPFTADGADAFTDYLTERPPVSRLPRYLLWEHWQRPDLKDAFPDPEGKDLSEFLMWAEREVDCGRLAAPFGLAARHTRVEYESEQAGWRHPGRLVPGICVAGYLRAELGMGELGRLALETVREAGIPSGTYVYTNTASRQQHPVEEDPRLDLACNLIVINGDQLPHFSRYVGPAFFEDRYTIGLWAWELEEVPPIYSAGLEYVDEVWTLSSFERDVMRGITDKPVEVFPVPITVAESPARISRAELGMPEGFTFLFCFDLFSIIERKNPVGLIEAFTSEFSPNEGPQLVLKVINGSHVRDELERLKVITANRPDVHIVDRYLDAAQQTALIADCDCYVSLHRSEGYGLTIAESMSLGKPVIATAYSGNMDFTNPDNSYLVPWTEGRVPAGCDPYPEGSRWADPDLAAAGRLMREVYERQDEANAIGARARASIARDRGIATSARFLLERFEKLRATGISSDRPAGIWKSRDGFSGGGSSLPPTAPSSESRLVRIGRGLARRVQATAETQRPRRR
jgi:glycosyltransferase involved in cell wall biosynthesis